METPFGFSTAGDILHCAWVRLRLENNIKLNLLILLIHYY
jgi:hypothetical protein